MKIPDIIPRHYPAKTTNFKNRLLSKAIVPLGVIMTLVVGAVFIPEASQNYKLSNELNSNDSVKKFLDVFREQAMMGSADRNVEKELQVLVGATPDGHWGKESSKAFLASPLRIILQDEENSRIMIEALKNRIPLRYAAAEIVYGEDSNLEIDGKFTEEHLCKAMKPGFVKRTDVATAKLPSLSR